MIPQACRSSFHPVLALVVLLVSLTAGVPAKAQNQAQWDLINDRITRLESTVRNMQGQTQGQRPIQLQDPQSAAQMALRVGTLEDQVRRLLGTIENLNHEIRRLSAQLERAARQGRLHGRSDRLADPGSPVPQRPTTLVPPPNNSATSNTGGLPFYDQSALDNLVVDEEPAFGSAPATNAASADPNPSTNPGLASGATGSAPGPMTLGTITLDQSGQVTGGSIVANPGSNATLDPYVVDKRTLDGQEVVKLNSSSAGSELFYEQSAKAQYQLGETHFARKDYATAAREFLKGYKSYKKSSMAPQSLVRLGMSLHEMGQKESACATFDQVSAEFPKARSVELARRESRRAGC